jgi:hypothetical protein
VNVFLCLALALLVYNSGQQAVPNAMMRSGLDYLGAVLFVTSVVPILVGLSLASNVYSWTSWQVLLPVLLGTISLPLFVGRELYPAPSVEFLQRTFPEDGRMLLGFRDFNEATTFATFGGALMLGIVASTLV